MKGESQIRLNETAATIVRTVRERPGIHFRGLARAADISSMGNLRHHVDQLQRRGYLVEVQDGCYRRYFVSGNHPPPLRRTLAHFSRPVPRRIGKLLLWRPMGRAELRRSLGCADSTLGYHLSRMSLQGDLVKTRGSSRSRYALAHPELVRMALLVQDAGDGQDLPPPAESVTNGSEMSGHAPGAATPMPVAGATDAAVSAATSRRPTRTTGPLGRMLATRTSGTDAADGIASEAQ